MARRVFGGRDRRALPAARTSRLTWINFVDRFPNTLAAGVRVAFDILAAAEVFQKFDSTIVKVLGTLSFNAVQVPVGESTDDVDQYAYLYVADENLPLANMPDQKDGTVQAAYLWTHHRGARIARVVDGTLVDTADPSLNWSVELDVKAQRRFRENNKTLWLVIDNGSTNKTMLWSAYLRTLVRIP